jgi:hypothetical protein
MRLFTKFLYLLPFTAILGLGNEAHAVITGIDFGTVSSNTPTNWTLISGAGTTNNLINENGDLTNIDVTISDSSPFDVTTVSNTIPTHTDSLQNVDGNIFSTSTPLSIVLSDLVPNQDYNIWLFSARGGGFGDLDQNVTFTGGNTLSFTQNAPDSNLVINDEIGNNLRTLDSFAEVISANSLGEITTTISSPSTNVPLAAGIAIEEASASVPFEFSPTLGLLLIGSVFSISRYAKSRKASQLVNNG